MNNLAFILYHENNIEGAKKIYRKAIKYHNTHAIYNYACILEKENNLDDAIRYYLEAVKYGDHLSKNNLGNIYRKKGQHDKAIEYYIDALKNNITQSMKNIKNIVSGLDLFILLTINGIACDKDILNNHSVNIYKNKIAMESADADCTNCSTLSIKCIPLRCRCIVCLKCYVEKKSKNQRCIICGISPNREYDTLSSNA